MTSNDTNSTRFVVSRESNGFIVWDRQDNCRVTPVYRRKATAQSLADSLNGIGAFHASLNQRG